MSEANPKGEVQEAPSKVPKEVLEAFKTACAA
jgi:hypothetical protein